MTKLFFSSTASMGHWAMKHCQALVKGLPDSNKIDIMFVPEIWMELKTQLRLCKPNSFTNQVIGANEYQIPCRPHPGVHL